MQEIVCIQCRDVLDCIVMIIEKTKETEMLSKTKIENNIEEIQELSCESFGRKTIGYIWAESISALSQIENKLIELGAKQSHITIRKHICRLEIRVSYHKAFGWEK